MAGGGEGGDAGILHLLMFPWPAFGHISPFAQLARKLVSIDSSIRVTFLTSAGTVPRVEAMLASSASPVKVTPLSLPHIPGLPSCASSTADLTADGAELLKLAVDATRPDISALLAELRPDAVLIDFATPWVCDLARPLGVKVLYFVVFSASSFAYTTVPSRHPSSGHHHDLMVGPPGFPATSALATAPAHQARDLTYVYTSFYDMPTVYDRVLAGVNGSDGLVMKTCREMEGSYIDYITSQYGNNKRVLLAGPVVPDPQPPRGDDELDDRWATWLSAFPDASVIFASFGSETFLPAAAATELRLGLEATSSPFLAVLNFPKAAMDDAAATELEAIIPVGFEERVEGRGVVHTGWVQQQQILRHRSVGCFVNHAGLSSVVEGLVAGCRLVMLPMVDQHFNARLFARELRVGVEVARRDEDGWFGREDVRDAVEAAVKDGGEEDDARKWREFFTDEDVQSRLAVDFVRELKEVVKGQA
ncbi:hypothetical protein HU200_056225 [Digitaria exilis]|uniref:Glycosyltransferase n=1 Tax=Digitaria exilis TaxID=1010633 RepID=A0A835AHR1_9POAL|nr:hypothetical protein HU200_056225 [Digitaria exilis]CAB3480382.1 unnamed protein product [Digitaria exilis]